MVRALPERKPGNAGLCTGNHAPSGGNKVLTSCGGTCVYNMRDSETDIYSERERERERERE